MVLDCALEVRFLGVLGGMMVRTILVGGCVTSFRGVRVDFAEYSKCFMMQDFGNCGV